MARRSFRLELLVVSLVVCSTDLGAQSPPPRFRVQVLESPGNPNAEPLERANAINEHGEAVGIVMFGQDNQAAYWSPDGRLTPLGTTGGRLWSIASDVNDAGQVVGSCYTNSTFGPNLPFLWTGGAGMRGVSLGPPAEFTAINESGTVLGTFLYGPPTWGMLPFLWTEAGGFVPILETLGGDDVFAEGINDSGAVTGSGATKDGTFHAFRWSSTNGIVDLGVLPGFESSGGYRIGDDGTVIGRSYTLFPASQRATVWRPDGDGPEALPCALPTSDHADANGLNHRGWIVGNEYRFADGFDTSTGVVWVKGHAFELDRLIVPHSVTRSLHVPVAFDVNDRGQIVGIAIVHGRQRAIRLDPITPMRGPWVEQ